MRKNNIPYRIIFIGICFCLLSDALNAQTLLKKRSVMGMGGVSKSISMKGNSYFIQQSIGQNGINGTIRSDNLCLVQGFIQPTISTDNSSNLSELEIKIKTIPFSDTYVIIIDDELTDRLSVNLYNILGKKIHSTEIVNTREIIVDLSPFASGYYILNIYSNKQQISTKLFKN